MIRVILNNIDISNQTEIDLSYVEKLDRELDEAFIVISHTKEANQYPMFSTVSIFENNTLLFSGRISSDIVELSSYDSDIYNHNITLVEHTKLLEKFFVRGKKFSQPLDPSTPKYTLYDVVEILRKTTKFEKTGQEQINAPYNIPQETQDKLENIIAPELTFKDVTLRQALDTVGDYINSISRLKLNGDLVFDNFNELLSEVDIITENYKKQQNTLNYQTTISSDVLNPVNNRETTNNLSYEYYPAKDLWTTLRSTTLTQFDFESSVIPTHKPIYEVLELYTPFDFLTIEKVNTTTQTSEIILDEAFYPVDISSQLVENSVYVSLELENEGSYDEKTKRNTIIYNYAQKGIKISETFGLFNLDLVLENALTFGMVNFLINKNLMPSGGEFNKTGSTTATYTKDDLLFNITYLPSGNVQDSTIFERWESLWRVKYIPITPSIRYEVVRDDITEVNIDTYGVVNQKLRIVDLQSFANNMKGRVNQLSESQLTLSHKVSSINDSYNVGDFTADKFVITKKEVIVQRDHYIINYELNKNFNKISQFVGIDQEIRQWEIGESGRTLDRDLNYNEFIEVYATNNELGASGDTTLLGESLFLSTFDENYSGEGLSYGIFSSPQVLDEQGNVLEINLPLYRIYGGNAFGFYTDFENNGSAGDYLDEGDGEGGFFNWAINRRYNAPLKYTNEIGRFETMLITAHNNSLAIQEGTFEQEVEFANLLPEFTKTPGGTVISSNFYVSKDSQERLKLTLLYHLLSKNIDEVIIGEKLSSHNTLFINEPNTIKIRVWNSDKTFITRDKNVSHTDQDVIYDGDSLTINDTFNYIEVDEDLTNAVSWAITDENGFPFVMVNGNKKRLVFEFNNKRSGIQYRLFEPQIRINIEETITLNDEVVASPFFSKVAPPLTETMTLNVLPIIYQANEFEFVTVPPFTEQINLNVLPLDASVTYQQLIAPIVTFSSITENTANMNIFNSNNIPVSFYYRRISPSVTSFQSVGILDDSSTNISLSGLSGGTNYVYESYFESASNSNVISPTVQDNFTTTAVPTYDITFNPNNGTWNDGTTTNKIITGEEGDIIYQPPQSISRTGFLLTGWNPSLPYVIGNSDDTITAQWAVDNNTYVVRARKFTGANPIVIIEVEPNAVYGGSTFTGFLNDTYQVIDDDIPQSTPYTLSLQAPQSFTEGGINYTFTGWVVNDTTYNNNNVTISDIEEDADITIQYLGFG